MRKPLITNTLSAVGAVALRFPPCFCGAAGNFAGVSPWSKSLRPNPWGRRAISCSLRAMALDIPFRREFSFEYGRLEPVAPGVRRIVARNPSPFTFRGTGTYVVGHGEVAVIDPGPDLADHVEALLTGLAGEQVTHILITHTHRDHSPAARALQAATGAPTFGFGPHAGGNRGDPAVEEGGDWDFVPDRTTGDGDRIAGKGWVFEAVHTPGHTSNHLCFALPDSGILFSGDHVMG